MGYFQKTLGILFCIFLGYFWDPLGSFVIFLVLIQVFLGSFGYFWYSWILLSTFGYFRILQVLLGNFGYFWLLMGTFGYFWVFWVLLGTFGNFGYFQIHLGTFEHTWYFLGLFLFFCIFLLPEDLGLKRAKNGQNGLHWLEIIVYSQKWLDKKKTFQVLSLNH